MKNRLLHPALFLMGLIMLVMSLSDAIHGFGFDLFPLCFGIYCVFLGGDRIISSAKKDDPQS